MPMPSKSLDSGSKRSVRREVFEREPPLNVAYEFLSLRPALYAAGTGEVRFRNFKYRALP